MAKQAKGKKALKAEQKAASTNNTAQKGPPAQKEILAEKPKNNTPEAAPKEQAPPEPASMPDKAIALLRSTFSVYTAALALLAMFMFYVRTLTYNSVFTNWPGNYVNVSADDGVYHMRLLFNTLQHFPFRILYDPFTHFPYGNTIHFGPLYELIPAAFLMVVGLGNPSPELVTRVAAYYPAVLGALLVIPVYYIGKKLFGKPAGLLSAIIVAFLPGALLWRSLLGVTDHHIAEVLFMACSVACLMYALDAARESKLSLEQLRKRDWNAIKTPLTYGALTGIFIGVYLLNWIGGILLSATLFLYFTVQAVIDHSKGRPLDYIVILSALTFLIPTAMILPYCLSNLTFQSVYYSLTQPVLLLAAFAGTCLFYFTSGALKKNKAEKWVFPVTILGMGVAGVLVLYMLAPSLFGIVQYSMTMLNPSGGLLTVQEAWPTIIDRSTMGFSLEALSSNYFLALWTALLGLVALVFMALRGGRQSMLAFLVWNIVMTVALVAQNRFTYYYGVNAALLTACLAAAVFSLIGADKLLASFNKKVDSFENFQRFVKKNMGSCLTVAALALFFIFIAVYPATPLSDPRSLPLTEKTGGILLLTAQSGSSGMPYEWYDALYWMKGHTPDPQGSPIQANFNYEGGQYWQPKEGIYNYPPSAYGVMSWWDYGHMIEYVAHRLPNANPFQAGIIEQNGTTGASPYFCTTDEGKSVQMLDALGSRYVVIDNDMATGKFPAIQKWIGDTEGWETVTKSNLTYVDTSSGIAYDNGDQVYTFIDTDKWHNSTMNRLYYGDASGMSHYRLAYESAGAYALNFRFMQYNDQGKLLSGGLANGPMRLDNYTDATERYEILSKYVIPQDSHGQGTLYLYGARPPVKYVKVFEKVKGATLTGSAPDGAEVRAVLSLKTDEGRQFNYTATATARNGSYSFVVPYPTEKMQGDGYSYGILPLGKYEITFGNATKSVDVPEAAVTGGATIQVT